MQNPVKSWHFSHYYTRIHPIFRHTNYLRQISTVPTGDDFSSVLEDQKFLHHSGDRSIAVDFQDSRSVKYRKNHSKFSWIIFLSNENDEGIRETEESWWISDTLIRQYLLKCHGDGASSHCGEASIALPVAKIHPLLVMNTGDIYTALKGGDIYTALKGTKFR